MPTNPPYIRVQVMWVWVLPFHATSNGQNSGWLKLQNSKYDLSFSIKACEQNNFIKDTLFSDYETIMHNHKEFVTVQWSQTNVSIQAILSAKVYTRMVYFEFKFFVHSF